MVPPTCAGTSPSAAFTETENASRCQRYPSSSCAANARTEKQSARRLSSSSTSCSPSKRNTCQRGRGAGGSPRKRFDQDEGFGCSLCDVILFSKDRPRFPNPPTREQNPLVVSESASKERQDTGTAAGDGTPTHLVEDLLIFDRSERPALPVCAVHRASSLRNPEK